MRKSKEADRAYKRAWAKRNKERVNAQARAWRVRNRQKDLEYRRRYEWRKRGVSEPSRPCPSTCEVCGAAPKKRALCLDHDHLTGEFRGWLCDSCNTILGRVKDNPSTLRALAVYLEQHDARCLVR